MMTDHMREKYDYICLYDTEGEKTGNHDTSRISTLMEEKNLLGENNRIANEAIGQGNQILGSLHRQTDMMEVNIQFSCIFWNIHFSIFRE